MDINKLKQGNEAEYKLLVETYQARVFNTVIGMVQSYEVAEDVAQEVFIEVFRSIEKFNEQSSLSTWIYRIAVNKSLDQLRHQKRQKRFAFISSLINDQGGMREIPHFDHPGIAAEKKEDARFLFEAVESLPDNQKTAFVLSQVEGLPQKEIAEIMDVSVKAVESLIQRAKAALRLKLEKIYDKRRK